MRTTTTLFTTFLLAICCFQVGCKNGTSSFLRWGGSPQGQGTLEDQKTRATVYDPFPMNDTGPEIVGARPRGFTNPLSEPMRNEMKAQAKSPWTQYPNY